MRIEPSVRERTRRSRACAAPCHCHRRLRMATVCFRHHQCNDDQPAERFHGDGKCVPCWPTREAESSAKGGFASALAIGGTRAPVCSSPPTSCGSLVAGLPCSACRACGGLAALHPYVWPLPHQWRDETVEYILGLPSEIFFGTL